MVWGDDRGFSHAKAALPLYGISEDTPISLLSLSENATFIINPKQPQGVLRIYRPGYQTHSAKRSELAWIHSLRESDGLETPAIINTLNGEELGTVTVDGVKEECVCFEFIPGHEFAGDALSSYFQVGAIAAKLHLQVQEWNKPDYFERTTVDLEHVLGEDAPWGDWRDTIGDDAAGRELLQQTEDLIRSRLASYDLDRDNSNLVHGDLRAANIIEGDDGKLWIIDFDDMSISWYLWDLCSTTTFIEHQSNIDEIVQAWLSGYKTVRTLEDRDLDAIPHLVFLRRLHILAWLGTHSDSTTAEQHGKDYIADTYALAQKYLAGEFLASVKSHQTTTH